MILEKIEEFGEKTLGKSLWKGKFKSKHFMYLLISKKGLKYKKLG